MKQEKKIFIYEVSYDNGKNWIEIAFQTDSMVCISSIFTEALRLATKKRIRKCN